MVNWMSVRAMLTLITIRELHTKSAPLLGRGRKPDRSGIQSEADGVGENLCRETKIESGVRGVWGGNHGWVHVESFDDSAWEGYNTAAPLGPPKRMGGPGRIRCIYRTKEAGDDARWRDARGC